MRYVSLFFYFKFETALKFSPYMNDTTAKHNNFRLTKAIDYGSRIRCAKDVIIALMLSRPVAVAMHAHVHSNYIARIADLRVPSRDET